MGFACNVNAFDRESLRSERFVHGDLRQPRREGGPALKLLEMHIGIDVRLLHGVLSLRIVSENGAGNPIQPLVIPTHHHLEQTGLSGAYPPHDLFVRDREALRILSHQRAIGRAHRRRIPDPPNVLSRPVEKGSRNVP